MGTVGYMSPEQVRGLSVDHRSDIFSFGVVLYEMLTGQRAFRGDSAVETMNAILKEDPAPSSQALPPALDRIVLHCIEKSPEERFQSARDVAFNLETLSSPSSQVVAAAPTVRRRRWPRVAAMAALAVAGSVSLFLAGRSTARTTSAKFEPVTFRQGSVTDARYAPDGRSSTPPPSKAGPRRSTQHSQGARSRGRSGSRPGLMRCRAAANWQSC
jgi:serine/threonine protein kinase